MPYMRGTYALPPPGTTMSFASIVFMTPQQALHQLHLSNPECDAHIQQVSDHQASKILSST
jgi:hypothetical protein